MDVDGDDVSIYVEGDLPNGILFNGPALNDGSGNATVNMSCSINDLGVYNFVLRATDGEITTEQSYTISVLYEKNNLPKFSGKIKLIGTYNGTKSYQIDATDEDNDQLSMNLLYGKFPEGLESNGSGNGIGFSTLNFKGAMPIEGEFPFFIKVSDGKDEVIQEFFIEETGQNYVPEFDGASNFKTSVGLLNAIKIGAFDSNNSNLNISILEGSLPEGITISSTYGYENNKASVFLNGIALNSGVYDFKLLLTDGEYQVEKEFTIQVVPAIDQNTPKSQLEGLVALFNSTDGTNWINNDNWMTNTPLDTWEGVYTNDNFDVTVLNLKNNNLNGELPTQIGNVNKLTYVDLSTNDLRGQLPDELGKIEPLIRLYLQNNKLEGELPLTFSQLVNLQSLYLYFNNITGVMPLEYEELKQLRYLDIGHLSLCGSIPEFIGTLSELTLLSVVGNHLSGCLHENIGSLSNLRTLNIGFNNIHGMIPRECRLLTNLYKLDLANNTLQGVMPSELGSLTNVVWLHLNNNNLGGAIPKEVSNIFNLQRLYLDYNKFEGSIPAELGLLSKLRYLSISSNYLTGGIPKELGNLSFLKYLKLDYNKLSKEIPEELGNLSRLENLYLSNNDLTGGIPVQFKSLNSVTDISIYNNRLDNDIPSELSTLTEFEYIRTRI